MATSEEFIPVGKGWVKVYSFTEPRANILQYSPLFLSRQGEWVEIKLSGGHVQGKGLVMGIANVTERDQVQPLIGAELAIRKDQLEPAADDEFYWADLIGLRVENLEGEALGQVDHLLETGANDVLVVKADDQDQDRLIPFVLDEVVKQVDLEQQLIQVDWGKDY